MFVHTVIVNHRVSLSDCNVYPPNPFHTHKVQYTLYFNNSVLILLAVLQQMLTMTCQHAQIKTFDVTKEKKYNYLFTIYFYICYIVFKNSWHVDFWELVFAEHDEKAGFTAGTITHYNQLLSYGSHWHCLTGKRKEKKKNTL